MSDAQVFFLALTGLAVVMCGIIWKWQLFELPYGKGEAWGKLALMSPLIGFLLFVGACAWVPGLTIKTIQYADSHGYSSFSEQETTNLSYLMALVVACVFLIGFSKIHPDDVRERIWGSGNQLKHFLKGLLYCILVYPIVMTIVQGVHLAVDWYGIKPVQEQVALAQLKGLQNHPWLFWSFAVAIVTLVPLVEEFLFRGLVQNYLSNRIGALAAIVVTSILFAFFHYSALQGATNIELMVGLFIYSYCIGLFYMREGSLWTPIAMHALFNAFTIFIMFYIIK